jgi:hypothetical protein
MVPVFLSLSPDVLRMNTNGCIADALDDCVRAASSGRFVVASDELESLRDQIRRAALNGGGEKPEVPFSPPVGAASVSVFTGRR